MLIHRREIRIEWGDCDPAGIVYFPRYFEFCDACTSGLFERAGFPKPGMLKTYGIIGIPIVSTEARFRVPCRFGDTVVAESSITEWGRSSFSVHHKIFRSEDLAVEIFEKRVWTARSIGDPERLEGKLIPDEVKQRFLGAA